MTVDCAAHGRVFPVRAAIRFITVVNAADKKFGTKLTRNEGEFQSLSELRVSYFRCEIEFIVFAVRFIIHAHLGNAVVNEAHL